MRPRTFSVLVLLIGVFAGCLERQSADPPASDVPASDDRLAQVLSEIPPPAYDREKAVAWWETFVRSTPGRVWGSTQNADAVRMLQSELTSAGYKVDVLNVKGAPMNAPVPGGADFKVVRALKMGVENPSHRLVLISHYDVLATSTQGAYDDGAGVAVELEICRLLAKVPTNKTIECVFFDGEEAGLVASNAYVRDYAAGGKDYVYDQGFGYDMTGMNWPGHHNWKLWAFAGVTLNRTHFTEDLQQGHMRFLDTILYGHLGTVLNVTDKGVGIKLGNHRNSDERVFERIGVPTVRFAGGYLADHYPMYHRPGDVVEYVYSFACNNCTDLALGRANFAKGMEMATLVSYHTIMAYDKFDSMQIRD